MLIETSGTGPGVVWEIDDGTPMVAFAGDWHGNDAGVEWKLQRLATAGVTRLFHVGDFALRPDRAGRRFLDRVDYYARSAGIGIAVTPGNHEDWAYLRSAFAAAGDGAPARIRPQIVALPRGFRWAQRGRCFVSYGGAASIDFEWRVLGESWWRDELPSPEEFAALKAGGFAEIMITHDSPVPGTPEVNQIRASSDRWSVDAVIYAELGSRGITAAWEAVHPLLLVHGHFHVRGEVTLASGQRIISLAEETSPGNILLLDLRTLETTWLEDRPDV